MDMNMDMNMGMNMDMNMNIAWTSVITSDGRSRHRAVRGAKTANPNERTQNGRRRGSW